MKRISLISLLLLMAFPAFSETNLLYGYVTTFGLVPSTNVQMVLEVLTPKNRTWNGVLINDDPIPTSQDTNGYFAFTNIIWGKYKLYANNGSGTAWTVTVPVTTNQVPIASLIGNATLPPNPSTNYYTQAQVDALLAAVTAGTAAGVTNGGGILAGFLTNANFSASGTNTVSSLAAAQAQAATNDLVTQLTDGTITPDRATTADSATSVTGAQADKIANAVTNNPGVGVTISNSLVIKATIGNGINLDGEASDIVADTYDALLGFNGNGHGLTNLTGANVTGNISGLSGGLSAPLANGKESAATVTNGSASILSALTVSNGSGSVSMNVTNAGTNSVFQLDSNVDVKAGRFIGAGTQGGDFIGDGSGLTNMTKFYLLNTIPDNVSGPTFSGTLLGFNSLSGYVFAPGAATFTYAQWNIPAAFVFGKTNLVVVMQLVSKTNVSNTVGIRKYSLRYNSSDGTSTSAFTDYNVSLVTNGITFWTNNIPLSLTTNGPVIWNPFFNTYSPTNYWGFAGGFYYVQP